MFRWVVCFAALLLLFNRQPAAADTPTPAATLVHMVQYGETLGQIASRYHTTVSAIARLNELANPQMIIAGQRLYIPVTALTATPPPIIAPEPTEPVVVSGEAESLLPLEPPPPTLHAFDYGVEAFFDGDPNDAALISAQMTTLGMRWAKVRVDWRDLEPTHGMIDYTNLNAAVDSLVANQINVLMTVTAAPDWARSAPVESGPPDSVGDYANFIGGLAAHFAGRVQAYEIWNEPNLRREWNSAIHPISADSYFDLLRAAYSAVKAGDPSALVVSAGLAPTGFDDGVNARDDREFLARLYELGLADVSDAVGIHPFGFGNPPEALCCAAPNGVLSHYGHPSFYFLDTLNDYRAIMLQNGDANTLLWATSFGWGTGADSPAPPRNSVYVRYNSPEQQADYTAHAFELAAQMEFIGVMIVYNFNGCATANPEACYYSLLDPAGQPRPVYDRLSLMFASALPR